MVARVLDLGGPVVVVLADWDAEEDGLLGFFRNVDGSGFNEQVVIAGADETLDAILGPSPFFPTIVRTRPAAAVAGTPGM